ncbi:MAG: hypothetical protein R3B96_17050 [Pirellulaceae bacterium]
MATPDFVHLAILVSFKQPGDILRLQVRRGDRRALVDLKLPR